MEMKKTHPVVYQLSYIILIYYRNLLILDVFCCRCIDNFVLTLYKIHQCKELIPEQVRRVMSNYITKCVCTHVL